MVVRDRRCAENTTSRSTSPDKSDYRTSAVPLLDLPGYGVYQALERSVMTIRTACTIAERCTKTVIFVSVRVSTKRLVMGSEVVPTA